MIDFADDIRTAISGNATLAALGTVYTDEQPEGTAVPYMVVNVFGGTPDEAFGAGYIDPSTFQVSIYSADTTALSTQYDALDGLFTRHTFTVQGGTMLSCQRIGQGFGSTYKRTPGGDTVYRAWIRFKTKINRSF